MNREDNIHNGGVDENDEDDANDSLTQFPPYGSLRPASQDWMILGYPLTQQPQQQQEGGRDDPSYAQRREQQQNGDGGFDAEDDALDESAKLNNNSQKGKDESAINAGNGAGTSNNSSSLSNNNSSNNINSNNHSNDAIKSLFPDWDPTEQDLWKPDPEGKTRIISITTANPLGLAQRQQQRQEQRQSLSGASQQREEQRRGAGGGGGGGDTRNAITATRRSHRGHATTSPATTADTANRRPHFSFAQATLLSPRGSSMVIATKSAEDRQHWMPDRYCKQCYTCEAPFTVFRRRHHCRLCGQVFCNPCSAHFLSRAAAVTTTTDGNDGGGGVGGGDGNNDTPLAHASTTNATGTTPAANTTTTIRVCHDCHQQVQQHQQQQLQQWGIGMHRKNSFPRIANLTTTTTTTTTPSTTATATATTSSPTEVKTPTANASATTPVLPTDTTPVTTTASPGVFLPSPTRGPYLTNDSSPIPSASNTPDLLASGHPTPKTQNVIQEALMQQSRTGTSPEGLDAVWHNLSQRSLLFLPDLGQGRGAKAGVVETVHEVDEEETVEGDDAAAESDAGTTATHNTAGNNTAAGSNLPARPSWFPLQRGASMGTTQSGWTAAASTAAAPVNPAPAQTEAVHNAEASVKSESAKEGRRQLGLAAANHLEALAANLLDEYAPKLWDGLSDAGKKRWKLNLLTLATRCCATVEPNVKNGDLIDIRPYCKIKVISGGHMDDCAYLSGIVFRKMVSHKRMAKELINPRIMLLSGGIEFTRHENQIASFEALFEQEEKYMEILVGKILKLNPDVLLVGRFVSRKAQELLLEAGVVLIQHVKASLLNRIARQTGAIVISTTDHIMNQFGADVLGKCHRFRSVTFRDNEVWSDFKDPKRRSVETMLAKTDLSNHERQAALAAGKLGQNVVDGAEAVQSGLAKRGVAQTYIMLEGCPKDLGCTIVLRGADRAALKEVKTVLRFLIVAAYSLRLETCYLKERCACIRPDFQETPNYALSTSLCVDLNYPPDGRNSRPWNGGTSETPPPSRSGNVTTLDHQSILITSVWMTQKSQCCPAEVKGICYYSMQDVCLGQFLRDSCFNLSLKCQNPNCKKSVLDHSLSFVHNDGLLNILVEEMEEELPPSPDEVKKGSGDNTRSSSDEGEPDRPIATWTYCTNCKKLVAPLTYISERTWRFSFGKFLETFFYNRDAVVNASEHVGCSCDLQKSTTLFFGCGKLAARFTYETVRPYDVFVRRMLPIEMSYHREAALQHLDVILKSSSELFVRFDKHIGRVSREARSLFQTAVNRPEHLQTVFSELNRIGAEVDHVTRALRDKVASVIEEYRRRNDNSVSESLLRFPWVARRYLFMLTSAWNEKLSAAGQAITAMRKIASATSSRNEGIGPAVVGEIYNEELLDSMTRLRVLNERLSSYNVTDINQALPSLPAGAHYHPDEYDDDFEEAMSSIDFADGVDADVMASRRRLQGGRGPPIDRKTKSLPNKSLGTRRAASEISRGSEQESSANNVPKNTPGGAVKSAFNRFFNRGGRDQDYYVVDLGMFAEGRPRLEPGVNGVVMPVFDEQWSSIIAYSLASADYASEIKKYEAGSSDTNTGLDPNKLMHGEAANNVGGDFSRESNRSVERRMLIRNKSHVKHTFRDFDEKGQVTCKFVCTTYWATQFQAVREVFLSPNKDGDEASQMSGSDIEQSYIESLSSAATWAASGGKSGASFSRTSDHRFVIKCISRTELQMFLDCAPAYFEYLSKAFFHGLPTVLCKIVGVYQVSHGCVLLRTCPKVSHSLIHDYLLHRLACTIASQENEVWSKSQLCRIFSTIARLRKFLI